MASLPETVLRGKNSPPVGQAYLLACRLYIALMYWVMLWSVRALLGMCSPVAAAAPGTAAAAAAAAAAAQRHVEPSTIEIPRNSVQTHSFSSNATAAWGKEPMVMSDKGPPNLLPPFFFHRTLEDLNGGPPAGRPGDGLDCPMCGEGWKRGCDFNEFADSCPEDLMGPLSDWPDVSIPNQGGTSHTLPYLMMDDMNCKRNVSGAADAIILEDSKLRVAVLPQSGGKVWSVRILLVSQIVMLRGR